MTVGSVTQRALNQPRHGGTGLATGGWPILGALQAFARATIRVKFVLTLGAVAALAVVLVTAVQTYYDSQQLQSQATSQTQLSAMLVASQVDAILKDSFQELAVIAADPVFIYELEANDRASLNARLEAMGPNEPDFTAFAAFNSQARMQGISLTDKKLLDSDYTEQLHVSIPLGQGIPGVGTPRPGASTGRPIVPLGVPVRASDGHIVGALQGSLSLEALTNQLDRVRLGERGMVTLTAADGRILVHPDESQILKAGSGSNAAIASALRGQPATLTTTNGSGESVVAATVLAPSVGWVIEAEIPVSQAMEPLWARIIRALVVGFLVLVIAGALGAWMAGRLTAPVALLRAATRRMARGEYRQGSLIIKSGDELEDLAGDFERMVIQVQESEARYRTVSEMTSDFAYAYAVRPDRSLVPIWVTDAFARVTGYEIVEIASQGGWMAITHPDDLAIAQQRMDHLFAGESDVSEFRILTKAGDERVLRVHVRPVWDDALQCVVRIYGAAADVTEQKQLQMQLERKNEELEEQYQQLQEASRLKSEFLANMSHELRTPLNGIIGFTELMHDEKLGPVSPEYRECLTDVLTSAQHLLTLINDVLDLAKIEAGKTEFRPERVQVPKLVGEVCDILRTLTASKSLQVAIEIDPELGDVVADPARVKQVLYNYLSNAIKFTPEQGNVTVRVAPDGDHHYRVEVEDDGIGIAPEETGRLFQEFEQLDAGASKRYQGTGLGLALTKRLVEAQGGAVGVQSAPGVGSVFFATFPRVMHCEDDASSGQLEDAALYALSGSSR
ncbi:MAG: hypothetical protein QOF51_3223 [Chloroflexota bacterium]|jgi:PAS domain S-box-containing protein|nr:hypothetical protein [Chloroflexota bacterium]